MSESKSNVKLNDEFWDEEPGGLRINEAIARVTLKGGAMKRKVWREACVIPSVATLYALDVPVHRCDNFVCCQTGEKWAPSLDDAAADDWEVVKIPRPTNEPRGTSVSAIDARLDRQGDRLDLLSVKIKRVDDGIKWALPLSIAAAVTTVAIFLINMFLR